MKLQQQLKLKRTLRLAGWVACGLLLFLCGSVIFPPKPEENANATVGTATPATNSVKLSISGETVNLLSFNLKPVSKDGTFAESNELTITASTDSYTGYTLSIAAQSGDNTTKLINTDATNCPVTEEKCYISPLPSTLSSGILKSDYIDPTSSEDSNVTLNTVRNTWGFNPSTYLNGNTQMSNRGEGVDEKYFPVSTAETNFAKTSTANLADTETGDLIPQEYTMKIGARVDTTIPMGTYQNDTFVIKAVGNGASYTINYVDSSGQANPSSMPVNQVDLTTYETTVALRTNTPTRSGGYYFAGWCSANTTTTDCNGSIYKPGDNFGIDQTSNDNTITLYAMWTDCQAGRICYKGNGNTSGSMGIQSVGTSATEAVLLASNFQRTGYGFLGWSTVENPTIGTDTIYGPMETVSGLDLSLSGMKLYAVWKEAATTTVNDVVTPVYLQDWNGCSSLTQVTYNNGALTVSADSFIALKDKRDNQTYAIARLADGNCWMIENLRLESEGTVGNNINDPNVTNQSLAQGYGGTPGTYGSFVGLASAESNYFADNTTSNTIYKSDGANTTYDPSTSPATLEDIGTGGNPGYRMPRYRNTNTSSPASSPTGGNANIYSYGNYYTWAAAIADTTYYGSTNGHTTVATSICPKGWHLPYGNSGSTSPNLGNTSGGFYYLGVQLGATSNNGTSSKKWRSFPNNFLYSGYAGISDIYDRGSNGYYWSSSAYTANGAYRLYLDSSGLYPGTNIIGKFNGFTVRCVVAPSP